MFKKIKPKIVLIYFLEIVAIVVGFYYASVKADMKIAIVTVIATFIVIGGLISIFLAKFVVYPRNKLIESAEKIKVEDTEKKRRRKSETKS